ncbi:hypothetical protein AWM75_03400 [Aerococcus urinaehominis]|uniref:Uncharacterized protein n=1 Tax=Aerococcus urinaehominis TaxID=128944 RepID=A0A0X8FKR1_9LACT|nr:QueT transporter family protein [Aerococcus urinaehominis]AMB99104.1 hypothetical protein AWM75_03400 [Aerococcus urinaehominis]SDM03825.1 Uncharacterized membrane protein [Aerococcus urinaehominis]
MNTQTQASWTTLDLTKMAMVAALYVVLTLFMAPISLAGLQLRFSEGLNFLALYNKRYIPALTLGVFIVNYFAYGPWDMVVGSAGTFIFLYLGRWLAKVIAGGLARYSKFNGNLMGVQYLVLNIIFASSMFTIALLVKFLGADQAFWTLYLSMATAEFIAMGLGGIIIYWLSQRIDFYQ